MPLCLSCDFTSSDSELIVRTAGSNRGPCDWHAPWQNTYTFTKNLPSSSQKDGRTERYTNQVQASTGHTTVKCIQEHELKTPLKSV